MVNSRFDHKMVLFDFDGTLADTMQINFAIMNDLARRFGFKSLTNEEMFFLKGKPANEVIKYFQIPWYKIPKVLAEGRKELGNLIEKIPFSREYKELIERVEKRSFFGVVTTNSKSNVEKFIMRHQLPSPCLIEAGLRLSGKSSSLARIIRRYQIPSNRVLYVGDEIRDYQAAQKNGIHAISVIWGYNTEESLRKYNPQRTVNTVAELGRFIDNFIDTGF